MKRFLLLLLLALSFSVSGQTSKKAAIYYFLNEGSGSSTPSFTEPTPPASDIILDFNVHDQVTR